MKIMYMVLGPFMTNTYILYNEETMEGWWWTLPFRRSII